MKRTSGLTYTDKYIALEDLPQYSIECSLLYCGKEKCEPGHSFGPMVRNHFMIFVFMDGRGIFRNDQKEFQVTKGDCFVIFPGENIYFEADQIDPYTAAHLALNGSKVIEYMKNAGFSTENPLRHLHDISQYEKYIDEILKRSQLTLANSMKRNAYAVFFISDLLEDYKTYSLAGSSYDYTTSIYVKYTTDYLSAHYQEEVKIGKLADALGISRNYLSICFKNEIGVSPHDYLTNLRIDHASHLLKNTSLSVAAIASEVGYEDTFAFSRIFKKKVGISPRQYRNSNDELIVAKVRDEYTAAADAPWKFSNDDKQ